MPTSQALISESQALLLHPWQNAPRHPTATAAGDQDRSTLKPRRCGDDSGLDEASLFHLVSTRPARLQWSLLQACYAQTSVAKKDGVDYEDYGRCFKP